MENGRRNYFMTNLHETYVAELGSNSRLLDWSDAQRTALLGADLKTDQTDDIFLFGNNQNSLQDTSQ